MYEQVSLGHLFERGAEGGYQGGGQALHEADGVGEQDFLASGERTRRVVGRAWRRVCLRPGCLRWRGG